MEQKPLTSICVSRFGRSPTGPMDNPEGGGTSPNVTNRLVRKYPIGTPNATEPGSYRIRAPGVPKQHL
jgi:hypothetical protein